MKKIIAFAGIIALLATGCSKEKPAEQKKQEEVNQPTVENSVFSNLDDEYILLKDAIVETIFLCKDAEIGQPFVLSAEASLYTGETTVIDFDYDGIDLTVTIDGDTQEIYAEQMSEIFITDIDETDDLYELAVYSEGASGDPSVSFMRYDSEDFVVIEHNENYNGYVPVGIYGDINADESDVLPCYGAIWTNQKGSVISAFQNLGISEPRIAFECFDVVDNKWNRTELEIPELPFDITISETFSTYFTPFDDASETFDFYANQEIPLFGDLKEFKKGDTLIINDTIKHYSYHALSVVYDGVPGIMTFWQGD